MKSKRKLATICLAVVMVFTMVSPVLGQTAMLTDIDSSWAKPSIERWVSNGIIGGYPDQTFRPDASVSHAEFIAFINRLFGLEINESNHSGAWYDEHLTVARDSGLLVDFPSFEENANGIITREDAATILTRAFKLNTDKKASQMLFNDISDISSYAIEPVSILTGLDIINGFPDGSFRPQSDITRAQAISLLDRLAVGFFSKAGTHEVGTIKGNVVVNSPDIVLVDAIIEGNLYLAAGIGDGDVTLNNVMVNGTTFVSGGGENSIIINDSDLNNIVVNRQDGKVRIHLSDGSNVVDIIIDSEANIEIDRGVTVETITANQLLDLITRSGANIDSLIIEEGGAGSQISGYGNVRSATFNADDVLFNGIKQQKGQTVTYTFSGFPVAPTPWIPPTPTSRVLYSFESNTGGWTLYGDGNLNNKVNISTNESTGGSRSLKADFEFGYFELLKTDTNGTLNLSDAQSISADVMLTSGSANIQFHTSVSSGGSWESSGSVIADNTFQTLTIDLTGRSASDKQFVHRLGFQVDNLVGHGEATLYVDNITYLNGNNEVIPLYDFEASTSGFGPFSEYNRALANNVMLTDASDDNVTQGNHALRTDISYDSLKLVNRSTHNFTGAEEISVDVKLHEGIADAKFYIQTVSNVVYSDTVSIDSSDFTKLIIPLDGVENLNTVDELVIEVFNIADIDTSIEDINGADRNLNVGSLYIDTVFVKHDDDIDPGDGENGDGNDGGGSTPDLIIPDGYQLKTMVFDGEETINDWMLFLGYLNQFDPNDFVDGIKVAVVFSGGLPPAFILQESEPYYAFGKTSADEVVGNVAYFSSQSILESYTHDSFTDIHAIAVDPESRTMTIYHVAILEPVPAATEPEPFLPDGYSLVSTLYDAKLDFEDLGDGIITAAHLEIDDYPTAVNIADYHNKFDVADLTPGTEIVVQYDGTAPHLILQNRNDGGYYEGIGSDRSQSGVEFYTYNNMLNAIPDADFSNLTNIAVQARNAEISVYRVYLIKENDPTPTLYIPEGYSLVSTLYDSKLDFEELGDGIITATHLEENSYPTAVNIADYHNKFDVADLAPGTEIVIQYDGTAPHLILQNRNDGGYYEGIGSDRSQSSVTFFTYNSMLNAIPDADFSNLTNIGVQARNAEVTVYRVYLIKEAPPNITSVTYDGANVASGTTLLGEAVHTFVVAADKDNISKLEVDINGRNLQFTVYANEGDVYQNASTEAQFEAVESSVVYSAASKSWTITIPQTALDTLLSGTTTYEFQFVVHDEHGLKSGKMGVDHYKVFITK